MAHATDPLLTLLGAIAESSNELPDLVQHQIAQAGANAKSNAGDRLLVALAKREHITPEVRAILESTSRAAAKVAWLNRLDHPDGYVNDAINKEKRVTVLNAVAAHPDTTEQMVNDLSTRNLVKIATTIVNRENASNYAVTNALVTLCEAKSLSGNETYLLRQKLEERADLGGAIAHHVTTPHGLLRILEHPIVVIGEDDIGKYVAALVRTHERDLPEPSNTTRWWGTHYGAAGQYHRALVNLLGQPHWDAERGNDTLLKIATRLWQYETNGKPPASDALYHLWVQYYGNANELAAYQAQEQQRAENVRNSSISSDDTEIIALIREAHRNREIREGLLRNPHVTLTHVRSSDTTDISLIRAVAANTQASAVELASALLLAVSRYSWGSDATVEKIVNGLDDAQAAQVGEQLVEHYRVKSGDGQLNHYHVLRLSGLGPKLFAPIVAQLSIQEISAALSSDYFKPAVRDSIVEHAEKAIAEGLTSDSAWQTFLAIGSESEVPLAQAVAGSALL